jgi:isoleucyl-tRNA synthetase
MSSPILRGGNLIVSEEGIRGGVRQVMLPLWSSWYFFSLYANAAGYEAKWSTASQNVLDRYLLAKTRDLITQVTAHLDAYDVASACDATAAFADVLTNWYIRRSRDRFWSVGKDAASGADTEAFDTLYTVLETLTRVAAPLLPFTAEQIWRGLTGGRSVHLTDYPVADDLPADDALVTAMDRVRAVCSTTSSLRKAEGLRVRLPLGGLTVVVPGADAVEPFADLIADEVNVKKVDLVDLASAAEEDFGLTRRLTVNARAAGPRLGKNVQLAIKGSKSGDWSVADDGTVTSGGLDLVDGEYTLETVVAQGESGSTAPAMLPGGGFVVLDTEVTDALRAEGVARDVIRGIQQARRDAGLDVSDRISVAIVGDEPVWQAVLEHQGLIMGETLAVQLGAAGGDQVLPGATPMTLSDGLSANVALKKVEPR